MKAGTLNNRLTIQAPGAGVDALGQPNGGWTDIAEVWGNVRHMSGKEAINSSAVTSTVSASIRVRYRTDLNAGMRVLAGSSVYQIKAVLPEIGRREYVDLVAELVA